MKEYKPWVATILSFRLPERFENSDRLHDYLSLKLNQMKKFNEILRIKSFEDRHLSMNYFLNRFHVYSEGNTSYLLYLNWSHDHQIYDQVVDTLRSIDPKFAIFCDFNFSTKAAMLDIERLHAIQSDPCARSMFIKNSLFFPNIYSVINSNKYRQEMSRLFFQYHIRYDFDNLYNFESYYRSDSTRIDEMECGLNEEINGFLKFGDADYNCEWKLLPDHLCGFYLNDPNFNFKSKYTRLVWFYDHFAVDDIPKASSEFDLFAACAKEMQSLKRSEDENRKRQGKQLHTRYRLKKVVKSDDKQ